MRMLSVASAFLCALTRGHSEKRIGCGSLFFYYIRFSFDLPILYDFRLFFFENRLSYSRFYAQYLYILGTFAVLHRFSLHCRQTFSAIQKAGGRMFLRLRLLFQCCSAASRRLGNSGSLSFPSHTRPESCGGSHLFYKQ